MAHTHDDHTGAPQLVQRMGEAAANLLASLTPDQRAQAIFGFDQQEERTSWYYTPIPRDGLPLSAMERPQQRLALQLVATGLSRPGYVTASTIMGLETTLDAREGWARPLPGRDSLLYYVRIFGSPHGKQPWGWSFEGHHISLNYTLVDGRLVSPTPTFFGANPAEAPLGGTSTLRPLQGVEDLARELIHTLDDGQRSVAIISSLAPPDIVATNRAYVAEGVLLDSEQALAEWRTSSQVKDAEVAALRYTSTPRGAASAALNAGQQEILLALVGEYIHRMPDELAEIELAKLQQSGPGDLHFAWAGGLERRQPHYYRIQGRRFLVEYDNTQNDANHIHSVWRDPLDDFGAGILARHYAHSH